MNHTRSITAAVNRSSLGAPAVVKLRARTTMQVRNQIKAKAAARESAQKATRSKR